MDVRPCPLSLGFRSTAATAVRRFDRFDEGKFPLRCMRRLCDPPMTNERQSRALCSRVFSEVAPFLAFPLDGSFKVIPRLGAERKVCPYGTSLACSPVEVSRNYIVTNI
jgi:hypothetical protein